MTGPPPLTSSALNPSSPIPTASGNKGNLRDGLWLLLRPTFLRVRQIVLRESFGDELPTLIEADLKANVGSWTVRRPLEPFSRYLEQLEMQKGSSRPQLSELYVAWLEATRAPERQSRVTEG